MLISFIGYRIIHNTITENHEKDVEIIVLDIKYKTSRLLSKLLHQYIIQKDILIQKHKEVASYLKENSYDINLETIKKHINYGHENSPYNIYVSNEKLVIKNTTYKPDLGFNLSFAKPTFDKHHDENIIGCSTPLFEKSSKNFLSYSDSYFNKDGNNKAGVLQVSYNYIDSIDEFKNLQNQINLYPEITELKAYIQLNDGFVNDLILKDFPSYKPDLKKINYLLKDGARIEKKLKSKNLVTDKFIKDGSSYRAIFISTKSIILNDIEIIYSILIDESKHINELKNFNIWMLIITILGIIAIFIIYKIREKEIKLSEQDAFVQSSMHEIKTPLSIITLNNELRELEFGKDEYSLEIDSAIKTLKTSYEDMSFTITKDKLDYQIELINLSDTIEERVEYFKTIANSNSKSITLKIDSDCKLEISKVELIRLIDNNLSNAIKYSDINTTIYVGLENNLLSFHNIGTPVKDIKHIFDKYFRENIVVGGHGLGLSIVNDIAKKYLIEITLNSDEENGTTFRYKFKCHSDDIS